MNDNRGKENKRTTSEMRNNMKAIYLGFSLVPLVVCLTKIALDWVYFQHFKLVLVLQD